MSDATAKKNDGLSLWALVAIAVGQVIGAGIVTVTGAAIAATGRSAWLSFGVAVIAGLFRIFPIIFFCSTVVVPGGNYGMVTRTLGPKTGGLMTISSLVAWSVRGTAVLSIGIYINSVFPGISKQLGGTVVWTLLIIANLFGINAMAKIQKIATPTLLIALMIFALTGIAKQTVSPFDFSNPEMFTGGSMGFASAVVLLLGSCHGQSMINALATRCKDPKRDLPRAMLIATGVIFVVYMLVGVAAGCVLPLEEIAGKPFTPTAKYLLPNWLFILFMIGGPIFALLTTMNSGISAICLPTIAGVKEGWLPQFLAKENKHGVPWISYLIIWVIGLLPLLTGLSIAQLTNFLMVLTSVTTFLLIIAGFAMPKKFPQEWKESRMHCPAALYYTIMTLSAAVQIYTVVNSLMNMNTTLIIINVVTITASLLYGVLRYRSGNIKRVDYV